MRANVYKLSGIAGACQFVWNAVLAQINEDCLKSSIIGACDD